MNAVPRSRNRRWLRTAAALALAAPVLAACQPGTEDLDDYIAETLVRPAPPPDPFEPPQDLPSHHYPPLLERDPFSTLSFVEPRATPERQEGPTPDLDRAREELEQYPLDALRMSGIIQRDGELWALVRDPQGTVHRVREGNYLGQNHGRIVEISERTVQLEEFVRTGDERWQQRESTLAARE